MCGIRCDSPRRVVHLVGFVLQYTKKKRVCVCVCMGRMHNAKHCSREEESVCVIVKRSSLLFYPPHSFNIYIYIYISGGIVWRSYRYVRCTTCTHCHESTARVYRFFDCRFPSPFFGAAFPRRRIFSSFVFLLRVHNTAQHSTKGYISTFSLIETR